MRTDKHGYENRIGSPIVHIITYFVNTVNPYFVNKLLTISKFVFTICFHLVHSFVTMASHSFAILSLTENQPRRRWRRSPPRKRVHMITLKLYSYTETETIALETALTSALVSVKEKFCYSDCCSECNYRHLCGDLGRALNYVKREEKKICNREVNENESQNSL